MTEYLVDASNHTGYQQVLVETVTDLIAESVVRTVHYTLGHDVVSQTAVTYDNGQPSEQTLVLGYDGHGSTRILTDTAAAIAALNALPQVFLYDAYGNLLNMTASQAGTSLLYSGEQFDQRIAMQYLRARYYDASNGRFVGLDPFSGNPTDPQSFHKYLYTHGDPINGIDPTGEILVGLLGGIAGGLYARTGHAAALLAGRSVIWRMFCFITLGFSASTISTLWAINGFIGVNQPLTPEWRLRGNGRPVELDWWSEGTYQLFEENVFEALSHVVRQRASTADELTKGLQGAKDIAKTYVKIVSQNAGLGKGGLLQSVVYEWFDKSAPPSCQRYTELLYGPLTAAAQDSGWIITKHEDSKMYNGANGWLTYPVNASGLHSFNSLAYKPSQQNSADWILDPWPFNKPDIFAVPGHDAVWPR